VQQRQQVEDSLDGIDPRHAHSLVDSQSAGRRLVRHSSMGPRLVFSPPGRIRDIDRIPRTTLTIKPTLIAIVIVDDD
jgi:hypothetical protein